MTLAVGLLAYLLGLCVGSFINVVVYRLPRGLSISQPTWSFCPHCRTTLRWQDNLPLIGWVALGGRCRYCRAAISVQYPLIEALTGLAFVLVWYLLAVCHCRVLGASDQTITPLVPSWPADLPLLAAWLILTAALMACSAMDLLFYVVDTRVTDLAMFAGIVLAALWPRPEFYGPAASSPLAAATLAAFVASGLWLWLWSRRHRATQEEAVETPDADATGGEPSRLGRLACLAALVVITLCTLALLIVHSAHLPGAPGRWLVPAAFVILFAAMVLAGGLPREIDDHLHATIEAEAPQARRQVLGEAAWLLPIVLAGAAAFALVALVPGAAHAWQKLTAWSPVGGLAPVGGAAYAVCGAVVAAAAGWIIRIVFTLSFGREAFGVGDIYILAAAGAAAGLDIALLGFLLAIPIALAGWAICLLLKRTGMIPFGPPLAVGFLLALWLNVPAAEIGHAYWRDIQRAWQQQPHLILLGVGVVLVAFPISVLLARLLRSLLEADQEPPASPPADEQAPGD